MDKLFNVPIETVLFILVSVFLIGTAILAVLALRNRVMFKMAVRNIPRRRAQSTLIIVGLMLATLLFSASFATGDTLANSIRVEILERVGSVDEVVRSDLRDAAGRREFFGNDVFVQVRDALDAAPVDGVMPAITREAPVVAPRTNLSEPGVEFMGLDPAQMAGFDEIKDVSSGARLDLGDLSAGELYLSMDAAEALDVAVGDKVRAFFGATPTELSVAGIYDIGGNATDASSAFVQLSALQDLLGREGKVNRVFVSNNGGLIDGAKHTDAVMEILEPLFEESDLEVHDVKQDNLDEADLVGSAFASIFLLFGNFSIIAGVLLIFLIFVMLAAERKRELGIARAVGAQRDHVVRLFTFEGAMYSILAAAVGSLLGVAVGYVMVGVLARAFGQFDFSIEFAVKWQSLVIAYTLGMAVTFGVVLISAGRVSALNIVRAIRDLPEPPGHQVEIKERLRGVGRAYLRAFAPIAHLRPDVALRLLVFGTMGAWMRLFGSLFRAGYLLVVVGLFNVMSGISGEQLAPFMIGASMVVIGVPLALLHAVRIPERAAYTVAGVLVVALWMLPSSAFDAIGLPDLQAGIEMFILSGVMLVIGGVWVVIYNSEYLVAAGTFVMGRGTTLRPVMRTALAYPMSSKFRTGMTLAMFSLVVFTLIVMSVITEAFSSSFNDTRRFSGGWDVRAFVSPSNPIDDLQGRLPEIDGFDVDNVAMIGEQGLLPVKFAQVDTEADPKNSVITAVDDGYASTVEFGFTLKSSEYETDRDVWNALVNEPDVAVVSWLVVPAKTDFGVIVGGDFFQLEGFYRDDDVLPEDVFIDVYDQAEQRNIRVRVIGVVEDAANPEFIGFVMTGQETLANLQPAPVLQYIIRLDDTSVAGDAAKALESTFLANGMQAESLEETVKDQVSINLAVNRLITGFMSLGIVVGVAALGVIAARSVVERRALIGMLRAIGYQRNMVQLSFLIESSFIALLGIAIGMALAYGLSVQIVNEIGQSIDGVEYKIPWVATLVVFVVSYGASLLTTFLPARQAASIYPAEALRLGE